MRYCNVTLPKVGPLRVQILLRRLLAQPTLIFPSSSLPSANTATIAFDIDGTFCHK